MKTLTVDKATGTGRGRLPDFLIIGAMKAGTTTLHDDLSQHSKLFLPANKEPDSLRNDDIFQKRHLRAYSDLFAPASTNQLCGEASTTYTNRPTFEGTANRARKLLGQHIKLIYIVRDPVHRAISHHHFRHKQGYMAGNINEVVRQTNVLIDYSRYAMQIEPWLNVFGRESLHVIQFESYIHNRQRELNGVCDFLGIPHFENEIDESVIRNRTADVAMQSLPGVWQRLASSRAYLNYVRPLISNPVGQSKLRWLRHRLIQRQPKQPDPVPATTKTQQYIADSVREDALRFAEMIGLDIAAWKSIS